MMAAAAAMVPHMLLMARILLLPLLLLAVPVEMPRLVSVVTVAICRLTLCGLGSLPS